MFAGSLILKFPLFTSTLAGSNVLRPNINEDFIQLFELKLSKLSIKLNSTGVSSIGVSSSSFIIVNALFFSADVNFVVPFLLYIFITILYSPASASSGTVQVFVTVVVLLRDTLTGSNGVSYHFPFSS